MQLNPLTLKETCGFHGYPAFPLNEERMEYKNPIPLFVKRCPPRNRQGFQEYLKDFGLNLTQEKASSLSDMALLAYTGGMLPTDSFSFLNTFEGVDSAFQFIMRVAGTQYHTEGIEVGSSLKIEFEPANQIDSNAILFKYQNQNAGYVPRPLQNSFKTWLLENRVDSSIVFKWNGTPEHPVLYAYISIQAKP